MKKWLLILLLITVFSINAKAEENNPYEADAPELQRIRCTCYTSKPTAKTYSGQVVRKGVISGKREWLGRTAILYSESLEFIEIVEFLDTGSARGLNDGTVIDLWQPSLADCHAFTKQYGDYVLMQWVDETTE